MARTRSQTQERQFKRRGGGVMKKADAVHSLIPGIKAAVLFLDGTDLWTYESEEGWVSSLRTMTNLVSITPPPNPPQTRVLINLATGTHEPRPFQDCFRTSASLGTSWRISPDRGRPSIAASSAANI